MKKHGRMYLAGVGQQQHLSDGSRGQDGVEGRELSPRRGLQLHLHHLEGKRKGQTLPTVFRYSVNIRERKINKQESSTTLQNGHFHSMFIAGGGWSMSPRRTELHLGDSCLEADVGDGNGGRRQHRDDDHQHVEPAGGGVACKVEQDPQAVAVKHGDGQ